MSKSALSLLLGLSVACGPTDGRDSEISKAGPVASDSSGTDDERREGSASEHEFSIRFDYRFDTNGWFDDAERRRALEAAASVWSVHLLDDFETIPAGTPLLVRNLEQLDDSFVEFSLEEPIDDLLIFAACSDALPNNVGGRTRRSATFPSLHGRDFQRRLLERWEGDVQQPWTAGIAFACNADFFFDFDASPQTGDDVPAGKIDFISMAAHEIGHALGIGGSATFTALLSDDESSFIGERAMEVYGGPLPFVGSGHFADVHWNGSLVLMAEGRLTRMRTRVSAVELAVLADIGYEIRL